MTALLPSLTQRSRFLVDWSAAHCLSAVEQALDARTGQVATFSRASIKSKYDANGVLCTVPHSLPAFEWSVDPVSGLSVPGVLLEDTRANTFLYSQDYTQANWGKSQTTVNANQIIGPDGVKNVGCIVETAANAEHYIGQQVTGIADNSILAHSVSVSKISSRPIVFVSLIKKDGTSVYGARFDVSAGTVTSFDVGITARVRQQANGFYRLTVIGSVGAGASQPSGRVQPMVSGSVIYTGNTGMGQYMIDSQLEVVPATSPVESSRIITTSGSLARAADALSLACNVLPRVMTAYVKFVDRGTGQSLTAGAGVLDIGGNGSALRFVLYENNSAAQWVASHSNTSAAILSNTDSLGNSVELRGVLNADGSTLVGASINGAAETTAVDATTLPLEAAWNTANIYFNRYSAGTIGFAAFQSVRIAAGVQSLAFMQAG